MLMLFKIESINYFKPSIMCSSMHKLPPMNINEECRASVNTLHPNIIAHLFLLTIAFVAVHDMVAMPTCIIVWVRHAVLLELYGVISVSSFKGSWKNLYGFLSKQWYWTVDFDEENTIAFDDLIGWFMYNSCYLIETKDAICYTTQQYGT